MQNIDAYRQIAAEASRGELNFPTNVNTSLQIQSALDDPDCHLDRAVKLVSAEPLLAARMVAMANSAAYNPGGREITNVNAAVSRLGFRPLRSLVAAQIMRQFASMLADPALRIKAAQLWEHSAQTAAIAHVLAKRITGEDPETAFFTGIVHDVGGFYLLSRASEFPGLLDGGGEDWREYGERSIGRAVMKKLAVPEVVMKAMEDVWFGALILPLVPKKESATSQMGNTILLAKQLAQTPSPFAQHVAPVTESLHSTIDFACGDGTLQSILQESADDVASLASALLIS
jgi:hypothetical protein